MSDQDFFFDEDEKPAKSADKAPAKKTGSASASRPATSSASRSAAPAGQSVTMTITILVGVIGLLLGVVIGLFVGKSMAVPSVASQTGIEAGAAGAAGGTGTGGTSAPQLTPEQLNSGQLPQGHPSIGSGAATGTPAAPAK